MRSGKLFEKIGGRMPTLMPGGAFMVEATKLIYPPKGKVSRKPVRRVIGVLEGAPKPV